jgi:hypothetical protein
LIDNNNYFIDVAENGMGRCLVLTSPWCDSFNIVIQKENIDVLRLSDSAGWSGNDLSFLETTQGLRGLEVYSWNVKDLTPLQHVSHIEYLGLQCEFSKGPDFSLFSNLRICKLLWKPKAKGILECKNLTLLNISNYPYENLQCISEMINLDRLQITSRKLESLYGIEQLQMLTILDIADCPKLSTITGVKKCSKLKEVEFEGCKALNDISSLGNLKELVTLRVIDCGSINTLLPLSSNVNLQEILFTGNTNIKDGDLSIANKLPKLSRMWFADRRHYSHKREQIKLALEKK